MSVVTATEFWPWPGEDRPLTVGDLQRIPDDGNRYELDDGVLVVSPAPFALHQRVVSRLQELLGACCPAGFEVLTGPGVNLSDTKHRVPDLVVIRAEWFAEEFLTRPPVLAVEVASRSTALYDRNTKKSDYERFGIPSYWIIDPDLHHPSLSAFELANGRYVEVDSVVGSESFERSRPFPVEITPSRLVAGPSSA